MEEHRLNLRRATAPTVLPRGEHAHGEDAAEMFAGGGSPRASPAKWRARASSHRRMAQHFMDELDDLLQAGQETNQAIQQAEAALTRLKVSAPKSLGFRSASVDHGLLPAGQCMITPRQWAGSSTSTCPDRWDPGYSSGAGSPEPLAVFGVVTSRPSTPTHGRGRPQLDSATTQAIGAVTSRPGTPTHGRRGQRPDPTVVQAIRVVTSRPGTPTHGRRDPRMDSATAQAIGVVTSRPSTPTYARRDGVMSPRPSTPPCRCRDLPQQHETPQQAAYISSPPMSKGSKGMDPSRAAVSTCVPFDVTRPCRARPSSPATERKKYVLARCEVHDRTNHQMTSLTVRYAQQRPASPSPLQQTLSHLAAKSSPLSKSSELKVTIQPSYRKITSRSSTRALTPTPVPGGSTSKSSSRKGGYNIEVYDCDF